MSKCICKQIAEMVEKNGCEKIHVCTGLSALYGYVDVEKTKDADGILILKNVKVDYNCGCDCESEMETVECMGISGLHIVSFHCGEK